MFTGIVECLATVIRTERDGGNIHFTLESPVTHELRIDQSVAHDGVCLTVVRIEGDAYVVTAIDETLQKTALGAWKPGRKVNLERSLRAGDRLDGHMVQGHVDLTGTCSAVTESDGSWLIDIAHPEHDELFTVPKGSICVNGVSLTVVDASRTGFRVAIIPYTWTHTTFQYLKPGDPVNLEFDIIGKYLVRYMRALNPAVSSPQQA
jgi:riboflavin synthase